MSQKDHNGDRLLSPKEASELAGVSQKTLIRWENDGLIECVRNGPNGHRRYLESDILDRDDIADEPMFEDKSPERRDADIAALSGDKIVWPEDWSTEKKTAASAQVQSEFRKRQKEKQIQERREANQRRKDEEEIWLTFLRNAGMMEVNHMHFIPGSSRMEYPPSDIILRVSVHLQKVVTLTTCPYPTGEREALMWMQGNSFAQNAAREIIAEWLEWERKNALAK